MVVVANRLHPPAHPSWVVASGFVVPGSGLKPCYLVAVSHETPIHLIRWQGALVELVLQLETRQVHPHTEKPVLVDVIARRSHPNVGCEGMRVVSARILGVLGGLVTSVVMSFLLLWFTV